MNRTLLLDLDDTLLRSNMDEFIPEYFKLLSDNLKDIVNPEIMLNGLMRGTRKMLIKTSPMGTLSDVFAAEFYELIQVSEQELAPRLEYFYDQVFPELGYLTAEIPGAIQFVEKAFKENDRVVIATNPMFPLKAVEHRLRWAGLDPDDYNFSLITAFEDFHFTKENLAYFPEMMGRLGWPAEPVVMVGNDYEMDITPSIKAGFPIFWVPDGKGSIKPDMDIPTGSLEDVYPWISDQPLELLDISLKNITSLKSALASTPAVFHGWLNPNGKCIPPGVASVIDRIENIISTLAENELKNLQSLAGIIESESLDQFPQGMIRNISSEGSQSLNEFLIRRIELLDLINDVGNSPDNVVQTKMPQVIELLRSVISEDIDAIRIAYKLFQ
jgi:FMN phosphatase YigB (HAD superfamily)